MSLLYCILACGSCAVCWSCCGGGIPAAHHRLMCFAPWVLGTHGRSAIGQTHVRLPGYGLLTPFLHSCPAAAVGAAMFAATRCQAAGACAWDAGAVALALLRRHSRAVRRGPRTAASAAHAGVRRRGTTAPNGEAHQLPAPPHSSGLAAGLHAHIRTHTYTHTQMDISSNPFSHRHANLGSTGDLGKHD